MAPIGAPHEASGNETASTQRDVGHLVVGLQRGRRNHVLNILIGSADTGGGGEPLPFRYERVPQTKRSDIAVVEGAEGLLHDELDVEAGSQPEICVSGNQI